MVTRAPDIPALRAVSSTEVSAVAIHESVVAVSTIEGAGAVHVFVSETGAEGPWVAAAVMVPAYNEPAALFGQSMDLGPGYLVVSAPRKDTGGEVYIYRPTEAGNASSTWSVAATLVGSNQEVPESSTGFGFRVSASTTGPVIAVSDPEDKQAGEAAGAVYVFVGGDEGAAPWLQTTKLVADGGVRDNFGKSVSIDGTTLVAGAPGGPSGEVHVFTTPDATDLGGSWQKTATLVPGGDAAALAFEFGTQVAVGGNVGVFGAIGDTTVRNSAGYAFMAEASLFTAPSHAFTAPPSVEAGSFGTTVALRSDGRVAVAGSDAVEYLSAGVVLVAEMIDGAWTRTQQLSAAGEDGVTGFGQSVSVDGDWVAVGAVFSSVNGTKRGGVYMYRNASVNAATGATVWEQAQVIGSNTNSVATYQEFGRTVVLRNGLLVATTYQDNQGPGVKVYSLRSSPGCANGGGPCTQGWGEVSVLRPAAGQGSGPGKFGAAVALSGTGVVAAGNPSDSSQDFFAGSVLVFEPTDASKSLWAEAVYVTAPDLERFAYFGSAVALSGDGTTLAVGAPDHAYTRRPCRACVCLQSAAGRAGHDLGVCCAAAGSQRRLGGRLWQQRRVVLHRVCLGCCIFP